MARNTHAEEEGERDWGWGSPAFGSDELSGRIRSRLVQEKRRVVSEIGSQRREPTASARRSDLQRLKRYDQLEYVHIRPREKERRGRERRKECRKRGTKEGRARARRGRGQAIGGGQASDAHDSPRKSCCY
eukprot:6178331-Pleurochrysis_carterae.AAC.2